MTGTVVFSSVRQSATLQCARRLLLVRASSCVRCGTKLARSAAAARERCRAPFACGDARPIRHRVALFGPSPPRPGCRVGDELAVRSPAHRRSTRRSASRPRDSRAPGVYTQRKHDLVHRTTAQSRRPARIQQRTHAGREEIERRPCFHSGCSEAYGPPLPQTDRQCAIVLTIRRSPRRQPAG